MKVSRREMMLGWATGAVVLAGLTYLFCEPRVKAYHQVRTEQQETLKKTNLERRFVAQKAIWQGRLSVISKGLPEVATNKDVTADMLIALEGIAKERGINLIRREADKEQKRGEIYEIAITCTWDGSLEALVHFLFELQQQGAMLDLIQLSVKPEKGLLHGGFVVSCAYRKGAGGPATRDAAGKSREAKP